MERPGGSWKSKLTRFIANGISQAEIEQAQLEGRTASETFESKMADKVKIVYMRDVKVTDTIFDIKNIVFDALLNQLRNIADVKKEKITYSDICEILPEHVFTKMLDHEGKLLERMDIMRNEAFKDMGPTKKDYSLMSDDELMYGLDVKEEW